MITSLFSLLLEQFNSTQMIRKGNPLHFHLLYISIPPLSQQILEDLLNG
jgi:hypothetical protein